MKIRLQKLCKAAGSRWTDSAQLYVSAFPSEERRPIDRLAALLVNQPLFHAHALVDESEQQVGILNFWTIEGVCYLEHFAIVDAMRSAGCGTAALQALLAQIDVPIVLEVEPPVSELTRRRIAFYERNGFQVLPYDYLQPSYAPGLPAVPLRVMCNVPLAEPEFRRIVAGIHKFVYGV